MCRSPTYRVEIRCRIHAMSSQEQPEDQPRADAETEDEQSTGAEAADTERAEERAPETPEGTADASDDDAGDSGDDDRPPTEDERLEQITERIDKARAQAEDAGVLEDEDDEEYVESGATETEDDQTITPPG